MHARLHGFAAILLAVSFPVSGAAQQVVQAYDLQFESEDHQIVDVQGGQTIDAGDYGVLRGKLDFTSDLMDAGGAFVTTGLHALWKFQTPDGTPYRWESYGPDGIWYPKHDTFEIQVLTVDPVTGAATAAFEIPIGGYDRTGRMIPELDPPSTDLVLAVGWSSVLGLGPAYEPTGVLCDVRATLPSAYERPYFRMIDLGPYLAVGNALEVALQLGHLAQQREVFQLRCEPPGAVLLPGQVELFGRIASPGGRPSVAIEKGNGVVSFDVTPLVDGNFRLVATDAGGNEHRSPRFHVSPPQAQAQIFQVTPESPEPPVQPPVHPAKKESHSACRPARPIAGEGEAYPETFSWCSKCQDPPQLPSIDCGDEANLHGFYRKGYCYYYPFFGCEPFLASKEVPAYELSRHEVRACATRTVRGPSASFTIGLKKLLGVTVSSGNVSYTTTPQAACCDYSLTEMTFIMQVPDCK